MGRLLSAAPLDQRRASPRLASHLQTLTAHFRGRPPACDPSGVYFASIFESMKEGWLLSSLLATVFAFGIGFVFILPRVRMLRAVLPEGNTPLSEAGRVSVQDPVILTLIRVRFLLTLGILSLMITKPDLATSLFIFLGAIVVGLISAATASTARLRSLS